MKVVMFHFVPVYFSEIPSHDLNRACQFYAALFGEKVEVKDYLGHWRAILPSAEGRIVGTIVFDPQHMTPSAQGINVYLQVFDLDKALEVVEQEGRSVVFPKTDAGFEMGHIAWIRDREGNRLALQQVPT